MLGYKGARNKVFKIMSMIILHQGSLRRLIIAASGECYLSVIPRQFMARVVCGGKVSYDTTWMKVSKGVIVSGSEGRSAVTPDLNTIR